MPFFYLHPHQKIPSIFDLDLSALKKLNIKGILLDIDNTITVWGTDALDLKTREFIDLLRDEGFQVAFITNASPEERPGLEAPLAGYHVVYDARKPMPSGFKALIRALNLEPNEIVMIGDQIFTDVIGANRLGMQTILVEPVGPDIDSISIRFRRICERIVMFFYPIG